MLHNIRQLIIDRAKGLDALTLAIWLLLAPNLHILTLQPNYMADTEAGKFEWIEELSDSLKTEDDNVKKIFKRIKKIEIMSKKRNDDFISYYDWSNHTYSTFKNLFPEAVF